MNRASEKTEGREPSGLEPEPQYFYTSANLGAAQKRLESLFQQTRQFWRRRDQKPSNCREIKKVFKFSHPAIRQKLANTRIECQIERNHFQQCDCDDLRLTATPLYIVLFRIVVLEDVWELNACQYYCQVVNHYLDRDVFRHLSEAFELAKMLILYGANYSDSSIVVGGEETRNVSARQYLEDLRTVGAYNSTIHGRYQFHLYRFYRYRNGLDGLCSKPHQLFMEDLQTRVGGDLNQARRLSNDVQDDLYRRLGVAAATETYEEEFKSARPDYSIYNFYSRELMKVLDTLLTMKALATTCKKFSNLCSEKFSNLCSEALDSAVEPNFIFGLAGALAQEEPEPES